MNPMKQTSFSASEGSAEERLSGSKLVAFYQLSGDKSSLCRYPESSGSSSLSVPVPTAAVISSSRPSVGTTETASGAVTASVTRWAEQQQGDGSQQQLITTAIGAGGGSLLVTGGRRKPAYVPWFLSDTNRSLDLTTRKRNSTQTTKSVLSSSASCENLVDRVGSIVSATRNSRSVSSRLLRTPTQTTRGDSIDSGGEIANIGVSWLRVNGAIQSFKNLLSSESPKEGQEIRRSAFQRQLTVGSGVQQISFDDISTHRSISYSIGGHPPSVGSLGRIKTAVSSRLVRRQELYDRRKHNADYALFFALLGIIMMILENELTAAQFYSKTSVYSIILCSFILLSTVVLLGLIAQFHILEIKLFMNDNSAEDWRIAMTSRRLTQIIIELSICAICPIPGSITFNWTTVHANGETVTHTPVPLDVILSIPMFFRMYLICRVMLLHSRLFTDASSRSIGALNRVNFNARFILKTLMTLCPGTVLLVFTASLWVIAAWIMRLCERYHTGDPMSVDAVKHRNYLNSLWLIAITFLSVGYGDIVPNTYCGRAVAVITGIMGAGTSSMVVAVIARKLELTRAEKHVHNFMMDTQLTKRMKHAAANVLRETWLIYKNRALVDKIETSKIRMHQRKFLMAIYDLRKVKRDQRKLTENSMTIGDIAKTSSNTHEMVSDMLLWQEGIAMRLTAMEGRMDIIGSELRHLTRTLSGRSPRQLSIDEEPSDVPERVRRRGALLSQQHAATTNG